VLTGNGLKDPETAMTPPDDVLTCDAQIKAIENAVLA
jgi:hypothetical protein